MIETLLMGAVPALRPYGQSENDHVESQAAVILRREQVKVVLFEGKLQMAEAEPMPGVHIFYLPLFKIDSCELSAPGFSCLDKHYTGETAAGQPTTD